MADINEKLKEYHKSMITTLKTFDINSVTSEEVSLRVGNKLFHLVPSAEEPLAIEDQIRKEIQSKAALKITKIGEEIKNRMSEISGMVSSFKDEYERKEAILKDTLSKSAPMPEITWDHAQQGCSLVKGRNRGELIWLVKRLYNPKFIDKDAIEPLYVKKLMTNIYIAVKTTDNRVMSVTTHYMSSLEAFEHYHQSHPDCWGSWKKPDTWKTPDDIIKIANDAISVLERINTMSIASRAPRLMPRLETLRKHILRGKRDIKTEIHIDTTMAREGIGTEIQNADMWSN